METIEEKYNRLSKDFSLIRSFFSKTEKKETANKITQNEENYRLLMNFTRRFKYALAVEEIKYNKDTFSENEPTKDVYAQIIKLNELWFAYEGGLFNLFKTYGLITTESPKISIPVGLIGDFIELESLYNLLCEDKYKRYIAHICKKSQATTKRTLEKFIAEKNKAVNSSEKLARMIAMVYAIRNAYVHDLETANNNDIIRARLKLKLLDKCFSLFKEYCYHAFCFLLEKKIIKEVIDSISWELLYHLKKDYTNNLERCKSLFLDKNDKPLENTKILIEYFYQWLVKKLYDLDGKQYAQKFIDEDGDLSVDDFLYIRCHVVANGKRHYESVLENPKKIVDQTCEELLSFPKDLYQAITGQEYEYSDEMIEYLKKYSWETYANKEKWQ
ncbi:MAG: DUF4240 domain-containing protein [Bacteroidetes bacterium]|nr:MAG: DUF4240 domain-containing protein [Bacteroidota bacterium]